MGVTNGGFKRGVKPPDARKLFKFASVRLSLRSGINVFTPFTHNFCDALRA